MFVIDQNEPRERFECQKCGKVIMVVKQIYDTDYANETKCFSCRAQERIPGGYQYPYPAS